MSWVKLNVGGEMMETTRETLTKFPDSKLAEMVNSTKDDEVLRLDLDPEYFRPVLNWLREGLLVVSPTIEHKLLLKMSVNLGLDKLAIEINKMTKPLGDWIKLDVGGTIFNTSLTTLTRNPDSVLGRMFDPNSSLPPAKMQNGAFLIDADPSSFPVILHWLRSQEVALGEVTVETALSAARYFGLPGLVEALEEISKKKEPESDWIKLNADGTIFQSSRATLIGKRRGLLAKMFDPNCFGYCPPPRDSNGAYLIDSDPRVFFRVLKSLRNRNNGDVNGEILEAMLIEVNEAYFRFYRGKLESSSE